MEGNRGKDGMTDEKTRPDLTTVKVVASTLASVSSALALSALGVAGTITGAAVGAVVATTGTELYSHYLERTRRRLRMRRAALFSARSRVGVSAGRPDDITQVLHLDR